MTTKLTALKQLRECINGPRTAGRKWVTYSREQAMAMLDVTRQLIELEEAALPRATGEGEGHE